MGWERPLSFMQYGKLFFKHRKIMQQHMSRTEVLSYNPFIVKEARVLVKNLLDPDFGGLRHAIHRRVLMFNPRLQGSVEYR